MTRKVTWHIQQNTTMPRVISILDFFKYGGTDLEELANLCQVKSTVLKGVIFPFLRNIEILSKTSPTQLTEEGHIAADIQQIAPDFLGDFFHLQIYNLHHQDSLARFSWVYATIVQQLWLRKEVILSSEEKKRIVSEVISTASMKFALPENEIAFSGSSLTGVLNWLRSLSTSVLESDSNSERFCLRYFCPAPIFLKAVDAVYQQDSKTYGTKIFLREEIKNRICQMLLLDSSGLDNSLDDAKRTYNYDQGGCFDWGYQGGYGQWVMLTKSPEWRDLI
ncbi:hypothetical protein IQ215_07795 [Cyanobacterium stanieri LEGE 03274]|uniref:Uncharacterized protein n=1 Tax=Cyanobacterium stanieri LEGE 03274 TaxID=1828756 RepID=A0ABR9V3W9_9CHRO|nr:hypothetical protein [Cyanobacterium stanieri]MBE9222598.1 hypothetical protein [Cyanobacterium stanieri LEGE 03274]